MQTNPYAPPTVAGDELREALAGAQAGEMLPKLLSGTRWALRATLVGGGLATLLYIANALLSDHQDPASSVARAESVFEIALSCLWCFWYWRIARVMNAVTTTLNDATLTAVFAVHVEFLIYDSAATFVSQLIQSHRDAGALSAMMVVALLVTARTDTIARFKRWMLIALVSTLAALALAYIDLQVQPSGRGNGTQFVIGVIFDIGFVTAIAGCAGAAWRYERRPGNDALIGLITALRRYWRVTAIVQVVLIVLGALGLLALLAVKTQV